MTEQQAWLALNAAELSPRTALDLLEHFGSARALLSADPSALAAAARLRPAELARLAAVRQGDFSASLDRLSRLGARLVTIRDEEYPPNLRHIYDPPPVLFLRRPTNARSRYQSPP